jgi:hypothetical protein
MFFTNPDSTNFFPDISFFYFLGAFKVSFPGSFIGIFDLNRKLQSCRKTEQKKIREKNS